MLSRPVPESQKSLDFGEFLHELKIKTLKENIERIQMDLKEQNKAVERLKRDVRHAIHNQKPNSHVVEPSTVLLSEILAEILAEIVHIVEFVLRYFFYVVALVLMVATIRSVFYLFTLRQKSLSWPVCIARSFVLASHDLCMADDTCFTEATWSTCSACIDGAGLFIVASYLVSTIYITYLDSCLHYFLTHLQTSKIFFTILLYQYSPTTVNR
jgi:hypothetical protein